MPADEPAIDAEIKRLTRKNKKLRKRVAALEPFEPPVPFPR